jgi:HlyD family secretion protein
MKKNNSDMKQLLMLASSALLLAACANQEKEYDATGTFEATELIVSAQQSGTLLQLSVEEGDSVIQAHEVGLIDTTQLWLKVQQLGATKKVYQSQKPDMEKQVAAVRQQLAKARTEQQRYQELVKDGAAPRKMLDDATSQVTVLQKQLDAQVSALGTQVSTLNSQVSTVDVQVAQLTDQLRKCHVIVPTGGTVLEK